MYAITKTDARKSVDVPLGETLVSDFFPGKKFAVVLGAEPGRCVGCAFLPKSQPADKATSASETCRRLICINAKRNDAKDVVFIEKERK